MTSLLFVNKIVGNESIVNGRVLSLLSWDRTANPDLTHPHDQLESEYICHTQRIRIRKIGKMEKLRALRTGNRSAVKRIRPIYKLRDIDRANTDSETIKKHMDNIMKKINTLLDLDNRILEKISAEEPEQEILDSDEYCIAC